MSANLNELLFQLVDGEALPLLQDRELGLLSIRGLVPSKSVFLPLWDVIGHHADASHVSSNLPTISCNRRQFVSVLGNSKWKEGKERRIHQMATSHPFLQDIRR